jgi:hypothetical protein
MKTELSPAAQAVASAYDDTPEKETGNHRYYWLAAALRETVNQLKFFGITEKNILAIATELEGQP